MNKYQKVVYLTLLAVEQVDEVDPYVWCVYLTLYLYCIWLCWSKLMKWIPIRCMAIPPRRQVDWHRGKCPHRIFFVLSFCFSTLQLLFAEKMSSLNIFGHSHTFKQVDQRNPPHSDKNVASGMIAFAENVPVFPLFHAESGISWTKRMELV